ncbi:ABC transporter ATP-binding protein [Polaromonas sp. CG_9.11]|uniref:ABC transporter ATP-binding protein n=1 Tax=Polaromonas sp. CG_9.11 TaxID=2787730 RepID=UPI0018CA79F3|nr:ABC transporter ATP-binding protein [Polaromonas sp. CG_9.11]MBG6075105.1 putative spermidine/putrescine transport system ATP-binding protein [Polaromonas sp. CG_9.11]
MTSNPTLVSFTGVQKTYDGINLVVRDLNLDIRQGEFLSLLGPSGSGKTTTLMMLAGFESPTAGEISLNGVPITRTPPHKRNFGMVFQNYALFPHMTLAENIAYPLTVRKLPKAEREAKVLQALDMVQLGRMGARYPGQLSGGQQQRVALARALVFDPQLVLMDEPLGALDKQLREHMQIELKALHRRLGVTFVYVTHDQTEALTMSDRVAVFNDGAIQQIDVVGNLYETPSNRFVAGFVGDSTVLQAEVTRLDGAHCEVRLPCGIVLRGLNVNASGVGDKVECGTRPERLKIAEAAGSNTFQSKVIDVIYFGDHLRLRCALPGQPDATLKMPLGHHQLPEPGQTIHVHAPVEHLRMYR